MASLRPTLVSMLTALCCALALPTILLVRIAPARAQPAKPIDKQKAAKQYVEAGLAAQDAGDYATALTLFGKAYELVPHPVLLFNIAQVHRLAGRPEEAVDFYQQYVAADPKGAKVKTAREFITALKVQIASRATAPPPPDPAVVQRTEEAARAKAAADALKAQQEAAAIKAAAEADAAAIKAAAEADAAAIKAEADARARQEPPPEDARPAPTPAEPVVTEPPRPARSGKPKALMFGLAAASIIAALVIDQYPDSSSNGSLDALDFAPVVLFPLGAGLIVGTF